MTPEEPAYAIISNDRIAGVRVGAKVAYGLVRTNIATGVPETPRHGPVHTLLDSDEELLKQNPLGYPYGRDDVLRPRVRFAIQQDPSCGIRRAAKPYRFEFTQKDYQIEIQWLLPGRHKVLCFIDPAGPWDDGRTRVVEYEQEVLSIEEDAHATYLQFLFSTSANEDLLRQVQCFPERFAEDLSRTIRSVEEVERSHPTVDPDAADALRRYLVEKKARLAGVDDLLESVSKQQSERYPIQAIHSSARDNVELRVFATLSARDLPALGSGPVAKAYSVHIVDWTDPSTRAYSGTYSGVGNTARRALQSALGKWQRACCYPEGPVYYTLPRALQDILGADADGASGTFMSTGGRFGKLERELADVLNGVAATAGLIALVGSVTGMAPVAPVLGVLLWTYIVSGTAGATLNIASRHHAGHTDWRSDAIDGLTIVSCLLAVPGAAAVSRTAWRAGATLEFDAAAPLLNPEINRYTIIGGTAVDGLQAILVAATEVEALRKELKDTSREPEERIRRVLALAGNLAKDFGLVALSVRDASLSSRNLGSEARKRLERVFSPNERVHIPPPLVRGNTSQGSHRTTVSVRPPRRREERAFAPDLRPEARARLGLGPDDPIPPEALHMLLIDEASANAMIARYGRDALAVHEPFARIWRRLREEGFPPDLIRVYHKHTGPEGVTYFDRLPAGEAGTREIQCGLFAAMLDDHYRDLHPNAGHSVECHGPHLSEHTVDVRIQTGVAPDGRQSPTRNSSKFVSFQEWWTAQVSAFSELQRTFGVDGVHGPVRGVGQSGVPEDHPIVRGTLRARVPGDFFTEDARTVGYGRTGVADGLQHNRQFTRPNGSTFTSAVYPTVHDATPPELEHFTVALGWTGQEWIVIQLFPARPPQTPGLTSGLNHGHPGSTI